MFKSRISGTGYYLPEKILSNKDLEKMVDTNDEWIKERTGIERRHIAAPDQATSDLGYLAAEKAITDSGLNKSDIDCIILGTTTSDYTIPNTACVVQARLGMNGIPAFDIHAACAGFVYLMSVADQYIKTGLYKNVLIIGSETISRYVDYTNRETCILFGDGAGAFVMSRAPENDKNYMLSSHLRSEGALAELFIRPSGGTRRVIDAAALADGSHWFSMKGREIFKHAVRNMSDTCAQALESNGLTIADVDWLIPHQANSRIMEAVATHFGFPKEKVINVIHEMGNTSAATIPVAFDMAKQDGRIKRGQLILFTAFGAGITAGSSIVRY